MATNFQVGKALAKILRHQTDVAKDPDGFVRLEDIQNAMWVRTDSTQIKEIVRTDIHRIYGYRFESKEVDGKLSVRASPNRTSQGGKGGKGGKGVAASSKGASELRCRGCNIILRLGHLHQPTCPLGRGEPVQENESMGWNAQVISDTPGAAPGGEGSHGFWHSVELQEFQGRLKDAGLSINDLKVIKDNSPELVNVLRELGYKDALQRVKVLGALSEVLG